MKPEVDHIDVTKTVFTVLDFLQWQRSGDLELRPYFQRGSVWTPRARSYLIDTLLRGYPVPVIYLQNKIDSVSLRSKRHVVDGQQRLRAILAFVDPELLALEPQEEPVRILRAHNPDLANAVFEDLPEDLRSRLLQTEISVHSLPPQLADRTLLELFARMNSTGEKLNEQELRNAEYHGEFKSFVYRLAYDQVASWQEWKTFTPRSMSQMRDVEFVSELALVLLRGLQPKSKSALDQVYREFDDEFPHANGLRTVFEAIMATLQVAGEGESDLLKSQSWVYAIFAYLASRVLPTPLAEGTELPRRISFPSSEVRVALRSIGTRLEHPNDIPEGVLKALRGASTDRSSRQARFDFVAEAFQ